MALEASTVPGNGTQEELDQLRNVIAFVGENNSDPKWIRLLFGVMGKGNGEGLFNQIEDIINDAPPEIVAECIYDAVKSSHAGRRAWGIHFTYLLDEPHSMMEVFLKSVLSSDPQEQSDAVVAIDVEATAADLDALQDCVAKLPAESNCLDDLKATIARLRGQ